jgi:hypothetical protein
MWLVPLGDQVAHGHLPTTISYATAHSAGWNDVSALGQLVFWGLYDALGGLRGLAIAQIAASGVAFGALAYGLRRQSSSGGVLLASYTVLLGALAAVVVTNAALFSLVGFALLLLLLQSGRSPWWAVPLLAVWANLHGGVLVGWALLACFVVLERRRALPVLAAATLALGLNPALWHTPAYYAGVFHSEVAQRGEGLWAPLGLNAVDGLLVAAALTLAALAFRHVRPWEAVALLGLAAATVHVSRNGVFFLFLAAYPAARAVPLGGPPRRLLAGGAAILAVATLAAVARGPFDPGSKLLADAVAQTHKPVLAEALLGQQVVLAGGTVWVENPIDAFGRGDQRLYLDWLDGRGDAAVEHASYVLVRPDSAAGRRSARDPRLTAAVRTPEAVLYRVSHP